MRNHSWGVNTHASVFLGLSRGLNGCVAPLALSSQAAPLALKCAALSSQISAGTVLTDPVSARAATNEATSPEQASLVSAALRLTVRLHLEDSGVGSRPLHACARSECGCLGVFYTCFGGGSAEVCVSVGLEQSPDSEPAVVARTQDHVRKLFRSFSPSISLIHNSCGQSGVASTKAAIKVLRSTFDDDAQEWRLFFRPSKNTGSCLGQVRVEWGSSNVVHSGGFEVRTKPHKWLLLQDIPRSWSSEQVRSFLAACDAAAVSSHALITIVRPVEASTTSASSSAAAGDELPHAFVQLKDRSAAHEVMKGYRALCSAGKGCGVLVSFLAGLSRAMSEDPTYTSVPVPLPSLACPTFVQPVGASREGEASVELRSSKRSRDDDDDEEEEALSGGEPSQCVVAFSSSSSNGLSQQLLDSVEAKRAKLLLAWEDGLGSAAAVEEPQSPHVSSPSMSSGDELLEDEVVPVLPVQLQPWRVENHHVMPAATDLAWRLRQVAPRAEGHTSPALAREWSLTSNPEEVNWALGGESSREWKWSLPLLDQESFGLGRTQRLALAEASYQSLESLSSCT